MDFSTDMFWWDKKEGLFSQAISSLDIRPGQTFNRGITLHNPKTGFFKHFGYEDTHYDKRENEVTHWTFISYNTNLKIIIWND